MPAVFLKSVTQANASEAQREAGNYRKKHIRFQGLDIAIENPRGSKRKWKDRNGKQGETNMVHHYGYIKRSEAADGEHVDCYVGTHEDADTAYVVHQRQAGNFEKYDEDKVMLGFPSEAAAREAYLAHYDDPRFLGEVTAMPMDEFKKKVAKTADKPGMIKSLLLLVKAHVKGHQRRNKKTGAVTTVHDYDTRVQAKVKPKADDRTADMFAGGEKATEKPKADKELWQMTRREFRPHQARESLRHAERQIHPVWKDRDRSTMHPKDRKELERREADVDRHKRILESAERGEAASKQDDLDPSDKDGRYGSSHEKLVENNHRHHIRHALHAGKDVPPEVLAEYPDLAEKYKKPAAEKKQPKKVIWKDPRPKGQRISDGPKDPTFQLRVLEMELGGWAEESELSPDGNKTVMGLWREIRTGKDGGNKGVLLGQAAIELNHLLETEKGLGEHLRGEINERLKMVQATLRSMGVPAVPKKESKPPPKLTISEYHQGLGQEDRELVSNFLNTDMPAFVTERSGSSKNGHYRIKDGSWNHEHAITDTDEVWGRVFDHHWVDGHTSYNEAAKQYRDKLMADRAAAEEKRNTEAQRERARMEKLQREVDADNAARKDRIDTAYKGAKFTRGKVKLARPEGSDPMGDQTEVDAEHIGHLAVHKSPSLYGTSTTYNVTHAPSGFSAVHGIPNKQHARIVAHRLHDLIDWDQDKRGVVDAMRAAVPHLDSLKMLRTDPYAYLGEHDEKRGLDAHLRGLKRGKLKKSMVLFIRPK